MPTLTAVIMAAGKGTRMKSQLPKVMHPLAGKPMIGHVLDTVKALGIEDPRVILGHQRQVVEEYLPLEVKIVLQEEQLGTGHALMQAIPTLDGVETVIVLSGDQPLLTSRTLEKLLDVHRRTNGAATILSAVLGNPFGYGRIIRSGDRVVKIVEEKDATPEERAIKEINTGTYCFQVDDLKEALAKITPQNAQGEYYLTSVFEIFRNQGKVTAVYCTDDVDEALGINSREQLAEAEAILRKRINCYWMQQGVTIVDPATTYIDAEVRLSADVTLLPFTFLKGKTSVERDAVIGPQTQLDSCTCGAGSQITYTVAKEAVIGEKCTVGPFAYLRPGTCLGKQVKVGDFVEIKNSKIGDGAKVPHLSYIGDSEVGSRANIGAGTITCNYDGVHKHHTVIGEEAFIGSNTNLVAPVVVGNGAVIGAGSTITKDVPANALAVERSQMKLRLNWRRNKGK